jgi:hypothetical protein
MNLGNLFVTTWLLAGALFVEGDPGFAHATYTPPPGTVVDPVIGAWVSGLYSDYGRCCELTDAVVDVPWRSSATSDSGIAAEYNGQWYDINSKALHIFEKGPTGDVDVTDNKLGQAVLWVQKADDSGGNLVIVPRCLLLGGGF